MAEQLAAPRRPASDVPSIEGLRISPPGFRAALVNISTSGLLAEWGLPLRIGQEVTVEFEGTFPQQMVAAHVIRNSVASITSGNLRYHIALAFTTPITLDEQAPFATTAFDALLDDVVNQW
jgi:hypothetical protein